VTITNIIDILFVDVLVIEDVKFVLCCESIIIWFRYDKGYLHWLVGILYYVQM